MIQDLFSSKKFIVALVGLIVVVVVHFVPSLSEQATTEMVNQIVALVAAYLVGQGVADFGKEKAKIEKEK